MWLEFKSQQLFLDTSLLLDLSRKTGFPFDESSFWSRWREIKQTKWTFTITSVDILSRSTNHGRSLKWRVDFQRRVLRSVCETRWVCGWFPSGWTLTKACPLSKSKWIDGLGCLKTKQTSSPPSSPGRFYLGLSLPTSSSGWNSRGFHLTRQPTSKYFVKQKVTAASVRQSGVMLNGAVLEHRFFAVCDDMDDSRRHRCGRWWNHASGRQFLLQKSNQLLPLLLGVFNKQKALKILGKYLLHNKIKKWKNLIHKCKCREH